MSQLSNNPKSNPPSNVPVTPGYFLSVIDWAMDAYDKTKAAVVHFLDENVEAHGHLAGLSAAGILFSTVSSPRFLSWLRLGTLLPPRALSALRISVFSISGISLATALIGRYRHGRRIADERTQAQLDQQANQKQRQETRMAEQNAQQQRSLEERERGFPLAPASHLQPPSTLEQPGILLRDMKLTPIPDSSSTGFSMSAADSSPTGFSMAAVLFDLIPAKARYEEKRRFIQSQRREIQQAGAENNSSPSTTETSIPALTASPAAPNPSAFRFATPRVSLPQPMDRPPSPVSSDDEDYHTTVELPSPHK